MVTLSILLWLQTKSMRMIYFTNIFESKVFSDETRFFEGSGLCGTYQSIDGVCATCTNRCSG